MDRGGENIAAPVGQNCGSSAGLRNYRFPCGWWWWAWMLCGGKRERSAWRI